MIRLFDLIVVFALSGVLPWLSHGVMAQSKDAAEIVPEKFTTEISFYTGAERHKAPFVLTGGFLMLQVKVNGTSVWAIMDNGAASTAIDASFVEQNGIAVRQTLKPFLTNTGPVSRTLTEAIEIDLPGVLKATSSVSAIDLKSVSQLVGKPVILVLGREYFAQTAVIISFKQRMLDIGPASSVRLSGGGATPSVPQVTLEGDAPLVSLKVNDTPVRLQLDLGFSGDVSLAGGKWDDAIGKDTPSNRVGTMSVEGTIRPVVQTPNQSVIIGDQQLDNISVLQDTMLPASGDGLLGIGLLSRFDIVVINFYEAKMMLLGRTKKLGQ